jgi:hypothetical protein
MNQHEPGGAAVAAGSREPALTQAEYDLLDRYVAVLRLVARLNPGRTARGTRVCMHLAAQLAVEARRLQEAFGVMLERGEDDIHAGTLARVLRAMGAEQQALRTAPP